MEDISRKGRKRQVETGLQGKNGAYGTQLQNTIGRYSRVENCSILQWCTIKGKKILPRGWTYYLSHY